MVYQIVAYRGKKRLGYLRDHKGKVMKFKDKRDAQTTANIESTQMESEGLDLKVVKI